VLERQCFAFLDCHTEAEQCAGGARRHDGGHHALVNGWDRELPSSIVSPDYEIDAQLY